MSVVIDLFHRGGPFMWLLLPLAFASVFLGCARFALARNKRFPGLAMGLVGMLVSTGVMADAIGVQQVLAAVLHATPETQAILMVAGLDVSRIPLDGGLVIGGLTAVLFGIGWLRSLGTHIEKGPTDRFSLALSSTSLVLALGALAALAYLRAPIDQAALTNIGVAEIVSSASTRISLGWTTLAGVCAFICGAAGSCVAMGSVALAQARQLTAANQPAGS